MGDAADKRLIRRSARARRAALPDDDRARWSAAIVGRLLGALPEAGPVMTYAAMGEELDLGALNDQLAEAGRLVLPRVEGRVLSAVPVRAGERLVRSSFGVPEPTGAPIGPQLLVSIVVPGLTFDVRGFRVGYGAGFYDRFLAELPDVPTIGVCFEALVVATLPAEPHDIPVARVLTEAGFVD